MAGSPLRVVADRATWYLAQAAILDGDLEQAIRHLRALSAGSPGYSVQAADQLQALESAAGREKSRASP